MTPKPKRQRAPRPKRTPKPTKQRVKKTPKPRNRIPMRVARRLVLTPISPPAVAPSGQVQVKREPSCSSHQGKRCSVPWRLGPPTFEGETTAPHQSWGGSSDDSHRYTDRWNCPLFIFIGGGCSRCNLSLRNYSSSSKNLLDRSGFGELLNFL